MCRQDVQTLCWKSCDHVQTEECISQVLHFFNQNHHLFRREHGQPYNPVCDYGRRADSFCLELKQIMLVSRHLNHIMVSKTLTDLLHKASHMATTNHLYILDAGYEQSFTNHLYILDVG